MDDTEETMVDSSRKATPEDELSNDYREDYPDKIVEEDEGMEAPEAESTTVEQAKAEAEQNESVEADRMQLVKKHSKRILKKQTLKLRKAVVKNQTLVGGEAADMATVEVRGRWVNVSD